MFSVWTIYPILKSVELHWLRQFSQNISTLCVFPELVEGSLVACSSPKLVLERFILSFVFFLIFLVHVFIISMLFLCAKSRKHKGIEINEKKERSSDNPNREFLLKGLVEMIKINKSILLDAPWGEGKTSVINMLKLILSGEEDPKMKEQAAKIDKDTYLFFEFNPWLLKKGASYIQTFYRQLCVLIRGPSINSGSFFIMIRNM